MYTLLWFGIKSWPRKNVLNWCVFRLSAPLSPPSPSLCAVPECECGETTGWELFYQFRPQSFLKMMDDRTGSVRVVCLEALCQSMTIDERFLCGYRLLTD